MVYRGITYRLYPGSRKKADLLWQLCGTTRFLYNKLLSNCKQEYEKTGKSKVSFFDLNKLLTQLRQNIEEYPWLHKQALAPQRGATKALAFAYTKFFKNGAGFPKFKAKNRDTPSFQVLTGVKIKSNTIFVPKVGWLKFFGSNPYSHSTPVRYNVKNHCGKWYVSVLYKIDGHRISNNAAVGIDRNINNIALAYSGGTTELIDTTTPPLLETKVKRHQRALCRKEKGSKRRTKQKNVLARAWKRVANYRKNLAHQVSNHVAKRASTTVLEDLKIPAMSKSAAGSEDKPGTNVAAKCGLNKSILEQGWGQLQQYLSYKCKNLIKVNPAYTSQKCHQCGHVNKNNRVGRKFNCLSCGNQDHADLNAAKNILKSGLPDLKLVGPPELGRRSLAIRSTAQGDPCSLERSKICEIGSTPQRHYAT